MKFIRCFSIAILLFFFSQCSIIEGLNEIKKPKFNIKEKDGKYEVKMKAGSNGIIYYTTDGSIPSNNSKRYTNAIVVDKGTQIKAIAYCPSGRKSKLSSIKTGEVSKTNSPEEKIECDKNQ